MILGIALTAIAVKTVSDTTKKKLESKKSGNDDQKSQWIPYFSGTQNCEQGYYDTKKAKHSFINNSNQDSNMSVKQPCDTKVYISMRRDSKDYIREDCFDVECELKAMGFNKINLVPRKDLVSESDPYMNQVFAIEVDGVNYFCKNQKCDKNSNIIVFYHIAKPNAGRRIDLFVKTNSEDSDYGTKSCSSCGSMLKFHAAKFCPYCGGKL